MPAKDFRKAMGKWQGGLSERDQTDARPFGERLRNELEQSATDVPIADIPLAQLLDNPFQYLARTGQDTAMSNAALEELADSIRQNGFYGALLARRRGTAFELAYGHRRRAAAQKAGLVRLPVKVLELSDAQMARIMASENFSREELSPLGEANVVGLLSVDQNMSAREIAEVIGKGRRWVETRLALYNAPADIKEMVMVRPDTLSLVPVLLTVKDSTERANTISAIYEQNLTREQVQQRVQQSKSNNTIVRKSTNSPLRGDGEENHNTSSSEEPTLHNDRRNAPPTVTEQSPAQRLFAALRQIESGLDDIEATLATVDKAALVPYRSRLRKAQARLGQIIP